MSRLLRVAYCVLRELRSVSIRRSTAIAGVCIALGVAAACTEIGTDPNVPVALAFDTLPSPSVIYGDTLRNIDGVATKLTGHAYNADGKEIPGAPIQYGIQGARGNPPTTIDSTTMRGILVATTDPTITTLNIRAQVAGIPSQGTRPLEVVPHPDTVDRNGVLRTQEETIEYAATDTMVLLNSTLSLRVLNRPNPAKPDSGLRGVRAWPVRFQLITPAGPYVKLEDAAARVESTLDTTGTDGVASRKIRLVSKTNLATGVPDSVVVEGTARNPQGVLPGAPIRFIVRLRKKTT